MLNRPSNSTPSPAARVERPGAEVFQPGAWEYVHVERPRCPRCACVKLTYYGTVRNGTGDGGDDSSCTRYTRCDLCGMKFKTVME
jgi:hypothetical protein